jgi:uncharacterized protein YbjT (DUF2867 family)
MIDTQDIAAAAIGYLEGLNFRGRNIQYLCGPKEYTMKEVTSILGASVGKPDMEYIEFPQSVF